MKNRKLKFSVVHEPRDLWVGAYIGREKYPLRGGRSRKLFLCLIPTVAFVVELLTAPTTEDGGEQDA